MKKIAIMCAFGLVLSGCCMECKQKRTEQEKPVVAVEPAVRGATVAIPCSYSCMPNNPCLQKPEPMVLKPRVTETVKSASKRRCCDEDNSNATDSQATYVPDAPEIYVISANRTVNSMLKEAAAFYEQIGTMKVYVGKAVVKSADLPGGVDQGTNTLRKRFSNISNVLVMEDLNKADYIVDSRVDWYDTATKVVPAIKYDMFLKDKSGKIIGEWSEIIHQAEGDRSWW